MGGGIFIPLWAMQSLGTAVPNRGTVVRGKPPSPVVRGKPPNRVVR
jgi:hypothetical protein